MVGKVLAVQKWEPEVGSTAPVQEAVCGNRVFVKERRIPGACCPDSLAKLMSSVFRDKLYLKN